MEKFDDIPDPLDLAFAQPKAGKKLKPGESLPGLEGSPHHFSGLEDDLPDPNAALSHALDDAFSNPNFGKEQAPSPAPEAFYEEDTAAIDAKIARNLDDAFANPKMGNKIEEGAGVEGFGLHSIGAEASHLDDLTYDHTPAKSGGLFGPKFLVIGMVLALLVGAVVIGGGQTTSNLTVVPSSKPTILRMD